MVEIFGIAAAIYGWCMKWKNPCPVHKEYRKGCAASTVLCCTMGCALSRERYLYFWKAPSHQPTHKSKQRTKWEKTYKYPPPPRSVPSIRPVLFPAAGSPAGQSCVNPARVGQVLLPGQRCRPRLSADIKTHWSQFQLLASLWSKKGAGPTLPSIGLLRHSPAHQVPLARPFAQNARLLLSRRGGSWWWPGLASWPGKCLPGPPRWPGPAPAGLCAMSPKLALRSPWHLCSLVDPLRSLRLVCSCFCNRALWSTLPVLFATMAPDK